MSVNSSMSFNPANVALHGRHLIEASAGTGKTYSIANLFLRLLLEPHPSQPDNAPLKIDRILVVTFTNAATDELRGRIRRKIEDALQHFRGGNSDDAFITQYAESHLASRDARQQACERLYSALLLVDDAAIFTIHSFASRAIQTFLFETGALADVEVTIGGSASEAQHLDDLVRLLSLGPHRKLGQYLTRQGINARKYVASLNGFVKRSGISLLKNSKNAVAFIKDYEDIRDSLLNERIELLDSSGFFVPNPSPEYIKEKRILFSDVLGLKLHHATMTAIVKRVYSVYMKSACYDGDINSTAYQTIVDAAEKLKPDGDVQIFCRIVKNIMSFKTNEEVIDSSIQANQSALLDLLQERKLKMDMAQLQPDDVIQLINTKLDDPEAAPLLRRVLTGQYPVCMVDEFQDTDPDQFRLFDRLYQDEHTLGLFAIGDPKQSIYAFRGADVFAYLDVKTGIARDHIHSLDINFRSTQGVMDGVNALFREAHETEAKDAAGQPVFVYDGIAYADVYSCEAPPADRGIAPQSRGVYRVGKRVPESLVFVGNGQAESQNFNSLLPVYARDCAERILSLLQGKQSATIEKKGKKTAVKPGDIAILVRGYPEADAMKRALANKRLAAVYLSQKDSVFQRCQFAKDLLFILRAMDDPSSLYHLKSAFATPLLRHFRTGTVLLDALDDDDGFENAIQQFTGYCKRWEEKGIFSALYQLFADQQLAEVFAAEADCDRLMTDFRHLGDLLQQQYLLSGSRERLIDWYASQLFDDSDLDEDAKSLRLESDDNLVKIVTLHGCKGLEYPVVFLPFFFGCKDTGLKKDPPFYHRKQAEGQWEAVLDFDQDGEAIRAMMQRERMAEDMRLLYVGITRAIYQCYIGISRSHFGRDTKNHLLVKSCWGHLLGLDEENASPDWDTLKSRLQQHLANARCAYDITLPASSTVFDADAADAEQPVKALPVCTFPVSFWQVTSYSALAYQKEARMGAGSKQDESAIDPLDERSQQPGKDEADRQWQQDIRYRLRGGATTGDCLHKLFERIAGGETLDDVLDAELRAHGLAKPEGKLLDGVDKDAAARQRQNDIATWLQSVLSTVLGDEVPALQALFESGCALPECGFDFALGNNASELMLSDINTALQSVCGASAGIARKDRQKQINGIMTGSIDLLFIHNKKIYVLDYKSNTLGKAPRFYDHDTMHDAMRESRYDLQYLIYSVAAHRYMKQRLANRYAFDTGEYSFGGVFYLFLRGMGLPDFPGHGVYFTRPTQQQIETLDAAFAGTEVSHA